MSRVEMKNGLITRESQSRVTMVRDPWWKGFTKFTSFTHMQTCPVFECFWRPCQPRLSDGLSLDHPSWGTL